MLKDTIPILSEQPVDLIILDLMMPKMGDLAFLNWLRHRANATMPIAILTSMVAADTEQQVIAAGGATLLYKPIKIPDLLE